MNDIKRSEITEVIYDDVMLMTDTVEMDRGERVEMMVDIYDSADTRHLDLRTNTERHQPLQHTGNVIHLKHIMTDRGIVVSLAFFSVALVYFFKQSLHSLNSIVTNLLWDIMSTKSGYSPKSFIKVKMFFSPSQTFLVINILLEMTCISDRF